MTDQHRFDQIGYASAGVIRTPNLDRLAADGVIFENAYSGSTTCAPARISLMTGLLDHRTPRPRNRFALGEGFWTIAHALRRAGYETALIGKMHFIPMRADHGFDHMRLCEHLGAYPEDLATAELDHYHDWLQARGMTDWRLDEEARRQTRYHYDIDTHPTTWVQDQTLDVLSTRDTRRPLFLVVSFPHPHPPINPPEPYASLYDPREVTVPDDGAAQNAGLPPKLRQEMAQPGNPKRRLDPAAMEPHRRRLALTYGLITQIDDAVGRIVDVLDMNESLLFFTSDHGDYAGHRGLIRKIPWIPFDDLARVPFFATGGLVHAVRTERALVQSFDFAVTCLDCAGLDVDRSLFDGRSLRSSLSGEATATDDRIVLSAVSMKWPMARRGPFKYIRHLGTGQEVLFDLDEDPGESINLLNRDGQHEAYADLSAAVDQTLATGIPSLPSFHGDRARGAG